MATVKHYLYAAGFALLAFFGIYLHRAGRRSEQNKQVRDDLDAMRKAKYVRDEIDNDPYFVDRAAQWLRKD